jgi:hypothetical protein
MKQMNYKLRLLFTPLVITTLIVSCNWTNRIEPKDFSEMEKWKLGWRLISSSWDKNYQLGEQQFDSLLKMNGPIETKFLVAGLDILCVKNNTTTLRILRKIPSGIRFIWHMRLAARPTVTTKLWQEPNPNPMKMRLLSNSQGENKFQKKM